MIEGFTCITVEDTRQTKYGRCSGGLAVFVKDSLVPSVRRMNKMCKFAIFLELSKKYSGYEKDILLTFIYLPPIGSTFYTQCNSENGIELLQEEIFSLTVEKNYEHIICGDLNARCGGLYDYIVQDGKTFVDGNAEWYYTDTFNMDRECKDKEHNVLVNHLWTSVW